MTPMTTRSKTLAAWLALLLGSLGIHRIYLHGRHDRLAWLYPPPTLLGLWGLLRLRDLGQDDRLAWVLIPMLGLTITAAMATAIAYALTPDERWDERHNPGRRVTSTGWGAVLAAIFGLMLGGGVLMATLAFSSAKIYEYQAGAGRGGGDS